MREPWPGVPALAIEPRPSRLRGRSSLAGCGDMIHVCVDVPAQLWEPRLVIFREDAEAVAEVVAQWTGTMPDRDVRLSGCRRTNLRPEPDAPTQLCYVAGVDSPGNW